MQRIASISGSTATARAQVEGRASRALFAALVVALLGVAFGPTLRELVEYWADHPEYSHGFLMPPLAAWLAWTQRGRIAAAPRSASLLGALLLAPCLALLLLGEMKLSWFLKPYALVGAIAALILALYGPKVLRLLLPALTVLALMCPLPGRVQNAVTLPLKNVAATLAAGLLDLLGFQVSLEGNLLRMPGVQDLWVADACSGIRSLISLVTLAIVACMSWRRSILLRTVVVVSAIPIAVAVNGLRLFATGVLAVKVGPEAAEGFFHSCEGVFLFGIAGLALWGWAALLAFVFPKARP